ncbi:rapamycin-insensitive companion of mTOR-like isoform X2 [Strongylocentrotus purpuratus]|uniref:Rapamycin-insensitive companion of mTOR n=1 Tax=Strongylocentrotus purpuratus TaxID=7668 RepID=A0A7M7P1I1_STRPU|nr:rapamycin-insensitive companion of mTOR-like isoform X2 [Strongylocentrotus purpuratus]
MAATMYRGRSLRRSKGRHDSGDTDVPLDLSKAPKDNIQEILTSLTRRSSVTKGKKLGHLNNFVKLINHVSSFDKLGYSVAEIVCCLRLAVVHPAKEIRGAGVRALRHLVQDETTVQAMLALHVDRLLMRSLDIYQRNDVERVQALRFIRRILAVAPAFCPISLVHVLVAISNSDDKERDRMRNACVATLCELAVLNPAAFAHARGLGALVRNILDMQLLRMNEAVMLTVLHLLNHPASRRFIRFKVDLEQVIAPFTDFNYRHTGDSSESQASEKEGLYQASRMAIVTLLRSWPGMIRLCRSDATGLQSLLAILCVHNDENRRYLLEVLYDIFYLPIAEWTDNFSTALQSIDSCQMKTSWNLTEGFVVAEALDLLPNRAITRPNLTENHLALLLLAFINAGLLESLVEVVTSDNANLSIQATILLGELLYMADKILPPDCEQHHHCLPTLMTLAASFDVPLLQRNRASAAVTNLERHHEMKKRGVIPCSLYLDHILSNSDMFVTSQRVVADKSKDMAVVSRENEDSAVQTMIKETLVLTTKDHTVWNWELIGGAIKKGGVTLKKFEDANVNRFFRRLVEFYKPMSKQYSVISLGRELGRSSEIQSYTIIGCQLLNFLLNCDETDAEKLLMELTVDIGDCLLEISMAPRNELPPQAVFSPSSIQNTLSQDYFLLVGKLSKTHEGEKILEKAGVFQYLLDVCSMPHHETLQKLVVTCLDYKRDGLARTVLGKMLAGSSESMRIYATNHLRVLLRAQTPFFHTWGVELLITQLHDKARTISGLALDILDEACEDDANLHSLVHMRPPLLHMGDKGALLLTRFISTTKGFKYLHDVNYVSHELDRWFTYFNRKYVTLIETEINEAFTCYHRPHVSGGFIRRSKDERRQRKDVYVPVHLYGQLAKHRGGCELIEKQNHIAEMCEVIRYGDVETMDTILNLKAALWALGHTGSTTWGLKLLQQEGIIPDIIRLAEECEVFSIRGTCFYVLGLISKTRQGADSLSCLGWESIRHSRGEYFPVVEDRENNLPTVLPIPLEEYNHNHRDLSSPVSLPSFSTYSIDSPKTPGDSSTPKVDPNVKFFAGEPSPVQSPLTPGGPPNFFLEVTGDTNSGGDAKVVPSTEERSMSPSPLVRLSKRDRVNSATEQLPGINEVSDGGRTIVVDRASRTPLLRRAQTMPTIEGQDDDEPPPFDSLITKLRSNSDASSRMCKDRSSEGVRFNQDVNERSRAQSRDRSHSLKRRCDSNESGNSSMGTKSRSESFATDTSQTSGVGSMHSNPSSPPVESSMSSVSTVSSSMTVKSIHSSDTLRKRHNLKRTPSFVRRISKTLSPNLSSYSNLFETSAAFTSVRDAHGYATLKALKLQHRQLSSGEDDSLIKRASSFGNPSEMKLRRGLSGMVESISMSCLERGSVMSKAPSMKSLHHTSSSSTTKNEYVGLCLPVDVTLIFHSDESQYKDGHSAPTSHAVSPAMTDIHIPQVQVYSPDSGSTANSNAPTHTLESPTSHPSDQHDIAQQHTLSMGEADYSNLRIGDGSGVRDGEEEEEVHMDNNLHQIEHCLACTKVRTRSLESQDGDSIPHPDDPASLVIFQPVNPPQPLLIRSRGSSSASASNPFGSNSVDNNTPTSVGSSGTSVSQSSQGAVRMRDDTPKGREMIRREVIRLVIKMSSSVGMKAHEEGLLGLREKFPKAFERTCLFSDVMNLIATSSYRLSSRRFIQELFQEVHFHELHHEAERILGLEESSDTQSNSSGS